MPSRANIEFTNSTTASFNEACGLEKSCAFESEPARPRADSEATALGGEGPLEASESEHSESLTSDTTGGRDMLGRDEACSGLRAAVLLMAPASTITVEDGEAVEEGGFEGEASVFLSICLPNGAAVESSVLEEFELDFRPAALSLGDDISLLGVVTPVGLDFGNVESRLLSRRRARSAARA